VAKVFSGQQVAINVGKIHNVEVGMLFDIVVQRTHTIEDPDTGELLGNAKHEIPKARVKVTSVQDKYSIASVYSRQPATTKNPNPPAPTLKGDLFTGLFEVFNPLQNFKTTEGQSVNLDDEDRYVSTGDPVVQVLFDAGG
jgi:hypothetical protein